MLDKSYFKKALQSNITMLLLAIPVLLVLAIIDYFRG